MTLGNPVSRASVSGLPVGGLGSVVSVSPCLGSGGLARQGQWRALEIAGRFPQGASPKLNK